MSIDCVSAAQHAGRTLKLDREAGKLASHGGDAATAEAQELIKS